MPPKLKNRGKAKSDGKEQVVIKPKEQPTKHHFRFLENLKNSKLLSLPIEIHTMIFRNLDKCSSTCLALTTKILYPTHFRLRGKVPLNAFWIDDLKKFGSGKPLRQLLDKWGSERSLEFYMVPIDNTSFKEVTKMITKDKKLVGGLELVGLNVRKREWDREWRRRGGVDIDGHNYWQWSEEIDLGYFIARRLLGGYEANGTWFYA